MLNEIKAVVCEGHRVASGKSVKDNRFPEGTIKMQEPFFKAKGLDFKEYFKKEFVYGTLNLSVAPHSVKILKPEFCFTDVCWTNILPAEKFYFSRAEILYQDKTYKALIYIPDPKTKVDHHQRKEIVEIIAEKIPQLSYGADVLLRYNSEAICFD